MSNDDREVIKKAQNLGAVFKRESSRKWYAQGEPYAFNTRLEAAYDYLEQHAEIAKTVRQRITEVNASHLNNTDSTTAENNQK